MFCQECCNYAFFWVFKKLESCSCKRFDKFMNFDDLIFLHRPKSLDDAKFFSIGTIDDDDKKLVLGP